MDRFHRDWGNTTNVQAHNLRTCYFGKRQDKTHFASGGDEGRAQTPKAGADDVSPLCDVSVMILHQGFVRDVIILFLCMPTPSPQHSPINVIITLHPQLTSSPWKNILDVAVMLLPLILHLTIKICEGRLQDF
jgi:hypothetical protein